MTHGEAGPSNRHGMTPDQLGKKLFPAEAVQLALELYGESREKPADSNDEFLQDIVRGAVDLLANHLLPGEERLIVALKSDDESKFLDLMGLEVPSSYPPDHIRVTFALPLIRVDGAYLRRDLLEDFGAEYRVGKFSPLPTDPAAEA